MSCIIYKLTVGILECNCYFVLDKVTSSCAIIDPGGDYEKIKDFMEEKSLHPAFIIQTHGHGDHIGASDELGLPIYIHTDDAAFLTDPGKNLCPFPLVIKRKPERLLKDGDIIKLGNLNIKVVHTPGHTPGGICLLCDQALFSGDTLFASGVGRTDLPYGNFEELMNSIENKLFVLDDKIKVYPGHGPATTIGKEKKTIVITERR